MNLSNKKKLKMKKNLLLMLPVLFAAIVVNAQVNSQVDLTSYRGAFAPAPTPMWTDTWTNFNPQQTVYGTPTVNISTDVTANTTWTANNIYLLQGAIHVTNGVTLTIEPGTVIMGDKAVSNSTLFVSRGGKLIANGTSCKPIVFTSNQAPGSRLPEDWGGVVLLGKAVHNLGTEIPIEGIATNAVLHNHGGTDNTDSSGSLRYVRIEFPGFDFATDKEINGLTMGSVGNKTVIDHIQVSFSGDDSFEWFGGAVSAKYLVAFKGLDDDFDTDNGFSGHLQHLLVYRLPSNADASQSNGIESDNNNTSSAATPKTGSRIYNLTQIGGFQPGATVNALFQRGAHLRRNTEQKVFNSIFMNNRIGLHVDGTTTLANAAAETLVFRNNIIAADFTANPAHVAFNDVATRNLFDVNAGSVFGVDSVNMGSGGINANLLTDPYSATFNYDWRPNPAVSENPATDLTSVSGLTDLAAGFSITGGNLFLPNETKDLSFDIFSLAGSSSNGQIIVRIALLTGFQVTVKNLPTLTGTPTIGVAVAGFVNDKFTFETDGANIIAKSIPGYKLSKNDFKSLAFTVKRPATGTSSGTNQTLSGSVEGGGDTSPANNAAALGLSAN